MRLTQHQDCDLACRCSYSRLRSSIELKGELDIANIPQSSNRESDPTESSHHSGHQGVSHEHCPGTLPTEYSC